MTTHRRRNAANLSLDPTLIAEARRLDIDISRAAEAGIVEAVKQEQHRR